MKTRLVLSALVLVACGLEAQAGFIDFESGATDLAPVVNPIDTGDNLVTITLQNGNSAYYAGVGEPRTAFTTGANPAIANDEAVDGRAGTFFMTDENTPGTNVLASNYIMSFDTAITALSLDIFDFRVDGGAQDVGSSATATLTLYADDAMTQLVGQYSYTATLENQPIDGNWETLSVILGQGDTAVKALLDFGGVDRGVGVDNIDFITSDTPVNPVVPEPSSFVLMGIGAVGLIGFHRRRRKQAAK